MPQVAGTYLPNPDGAIKFLAVEYMSNVGSVTHDWIETEITGSPGNPALACLPNVEADFPAGSPLAPLVTYRLRVPDGGTFTLYFKGRAPGGSSDNFVHVRFDDGGWVQERVPTNFNWLERGTYSLGAGDHDFVIQPRLDGVEINTVLLSPSSGLNNLQCEVQAYSTRDAGSPPGRRRRSRWR